jgi:DNA gyrase inhibitor GyrI
MRTGTMNQLAKWAEMGYLAPGYPGSIATTVRWDDPAETSPIGCAPMWT